MQEHGELALMEHWEVETDGRQERDKERSGEREKERQTDRQTGEGKEGACGVAR